MTRSPHPPTSTFVDLLRWRALQHPDKNAFRFLLDGETLPTDYWRDQTRHTVQFLEGIQTAYAQGGRVFIEIGPSDTLTHIGPRCLPDTPDTSWFSSLKQGSDDWEILLSSVAALYVQGYAIDWTTFHRPYTPTRLSLPTYPFERQRYWFIEAPLEQVSALKTRTDGQYQEYQGNGLEKKHEGKFNKNCPTTCGYFSK